jgi:hypothetical protein
MLAIALIAAFIAAPADAKKSGSEIRNEQSPSGRGPGLDDRGGRSGMSDRDEGSSNNSGSGNSGSSSGSNSGSSNHGGGDAVSSSLDSLSSGKGHGDSGSGHGLPSGSNSTTSSGPGSKTSVVVISDEDRHSAVSVVRSVMRVIGLPLSWGAR